MAILLAWLLVLRPSVCKPRHKVGKSPHLGVRKVHSQVSLLLCDWDAHVAIRSDADPTFFYPNSLAHQVGMHPIEAFHASSPSELLFYVHISK